MFDEKDDEQKENAPEGVNERKSKAVTKEEIIDLSKDNRLSSLVENLHGSERYTIIREYILKELENQPITLSDGKQAVVDRSDAKHIARNAGSKKVSEISHIKRIIELAKLVAEEESIKDGKFDYFWYYQANVSYEGEVIPVYVNVGRARNDLSYHIYDITQKIRDTAHRVNDVGRPVGYALENGISNNTISQDKDIVNSNSTQKFEKDASNSKKSSSGINERASKTSNRERLEDRVGGDELLDAQDLIEVVKEKGGDVDEKGYITLYHRTSAENAEKIRSTGYMKGKEDGLFFSTAKEGYASGYGDTVVEFSIPAEKLVLDDIFDNEAHLKLPMKQAGMKNVKPYLITESADSKRLTEDDLKTYIDAGTRANKSKLNALREGKKIILTSKDEITSFINSSIQGERGLTTVAYGKVADRLARDVESYSKGKIKITGNFLELVPDEINHAYKNHLNAKQEGDIDLSVQDFENIPEYIDHYDDLVYAIKFESGNTRICLSKKLKNGRVVLIETVSKSRGSVEFKNIIGVSEEKYITDYENRYKKRSSSNSGGSQSSNISPHDKSASTNSIPQKSDLSTEKSDINERSSKTKKTDTAADTRSSGEKNREAIETKNFEGLSVNDIVKGSGIDPKHIVESIGGDLFSGDFGQSYGDIYGKRATAVRVALEKALNAKTTNESRKMVADHIADFAVKNNILEGVLQSDNFIDNKILQIYYNIY